MSNLKKILRIDKKYTYNTFFLNIENFSLKKIQLNLNIIYLNYN